MSSPVENRAPVFTSQPQAVEVYQSGAWWPGELLGWRHDVDGACQVWVRVELGGVEESAWTDLAALRLPERQSLPAPVGASANAEATGRVLPRDEGVRDLAETASLPRVRDRVAPARAAGAAARAGGRRRAPETGPLAATPAIAAAGFSSAGAGAGVRGRHRAPADPGRHRAADTGMLPAIGVTPRDVPSPRAARVEEPLGTPESFATSARDRRATVDPEPEMLTRPMRLTDMAPHSRRPRVDGSLAGV